MKSIIQKLFASVLVCALVFSTSAVTVFATEPSSVPVTVQEIVDESGIDATVTTLNQSEYDELWVTAITKQQSVVDFLNKTVADGYQMLSGQNGVAVKVTDNIQQQNNAYMMSKAFQNENGETLVAMFIFNPQTNSILRIYAEKVGVDNVSSLYHKYDNLVLPRTRDFSMQSFLCGLTGAVACGAFSAMLFMFVPASIAVGMSCSTAFAYVCGYA